MISLKGPGLRIFAVIIAVAALAFGVYSTFIQSAGYLKTTATIVSIEEDLESGEEDSYIVTVRYTVGDKEYINVLDSYSPSYEAGGTVEIRYDPADPNKITSGYGIDLMPFLSSVKINMAILHVEVIQGNTIGISVITEHGQNSTRLFFKDPYTLLITDLLLKSSHFTKHITLLTQADHLNRMQPQMSCLQYLLST